MREAFCLWAAKCPSNEDNDGEIASLAIFLMTTAVFILSVTPSQGTAAAAAGLSFQPAFLSYFAPPGIFFPRFHLKGLLHTDAFFFHAKIKIYTGLLPEIKCFHTDLQK